MGDDTPRGETALRTLSTARERSASHGSTLDPRRSALRGSTLDRRHGILARAPEETYLYTRPLSAQRTISTLISGYAHRRHPISTRATSTTEWPTLS